MELDEAIGNLKKQLENTKKASECGLATKGEFKEDIQAIETVLEALENKQKDIENYEQMYDEDEKKIRNLQWKNEIYVKLNKIFIFKFSICPTIKNMVRVPSMPKTLI